MDVELPQLVARAAAFLNDDRMLLPAETMAWRLGAAAVVGFAIGAERERRGKDAGLRTHMLTAIAAALVMLVSLELFHRFSGEGSMDPIRVVEAVTTGVAFLGAGVIFRDGDRMRGLTTGAGMWLAAAAGLACGAGLFRLALVAAIIAVLVMSLVKMLEGSIQKETARDTDRGPSEIPGASER
jgi:putative Mg2+ transporter-C (MgtC) family protein